MMSRQYKIYKDSSGYCPYGAARQVWQCRASEVMLEGPYETGKTRGNLEKVHLFLAKYPRARGLMCRKTYKSLVSSGIVTYEQKVLPFSPSDPLRCPVYRFGGERPNWYDYPNGARLECRGLDDLASIESSEYDIIVVLQSEELGLEQWEVLSKCASGRAGNAPYAQLLGDCNPGPANHWILNRDRLARFKSVHQDNPTLYHPETGEMTKQGEITMGVLDGLTGVRYKRGKLGLWVSAEGAIYEGFDPAFHLVDEFDMKQATQIIAGVDWGFTNPGVIAIYAQDGDGRLYRVAETYRTQKLTNWWVNKAQAYQGKYNVDVFVCDPSNRDGIEAFKAAGLNAVGANNSVKPGLDAVKSRLKGAGDGRPRLYFLADALDEPDPLLLIGGQRKSGIPICTEDEFPYYVYAKSGDTDMPSKNQVDHGLDVLRYVCMYVDHQPEPGRAESHARSSAELLKPATSTHKKTDRNKILGR